MKKLIMLMIAVCVSIGAAATTGEPFELKEYLPDPMALTKDGPARVSTAVATDADYTEWESLGVATLDGEYDSLKATLDYWSTESDTEITFANTTEVMVRHLRTDADVMQFKFCKFWGYNDMIADYDVTTCTASLPSTPTGMPIPTKIKETFGCESLNFFCSRIEYSEVRKIFRFLNPWILVFDNQGFYGANFNAVLPGANPDAGFTFSPKSGGVKSTDKSITLGITLTEVDHVRYIVKYMASFYNPEIDGIINGEIEYQEAKESITIEYNKGCGIYNVLALAFDAEDKYMGFFRTYTCLSNLAPEGTWESVGKGIWHHPYSREHNYLEAGTDAVTVFTFPEENLQWEVEIEKRTDTDREIYRVVNPYSPTCGIAVPYNELLDKWYNAIPEERPDAFISDDTFWFVFDVTDRNNITMEENRPTGNNDGLFMDMYFKSRSDNSEFTYKDRTLRMKGFSDYDLVVEMPSYRGIGFEYVGNQDGAVTGKIGPVTAEVRYVLIPDPGTRPTDAEFAAEADKVIKGSTSYEVHKVSRGEVGDEVSLPYADYLEGPSWMLVVPVDAAGVPFDYSVVPLSFVKEVYTGVVLTECLLAPFFSGDMHFDINNLTIKCVKHAGEPERDYYTLPNPYKNDPGWFNAISISTKEVGDWTFVHDYSEGQNVVTLENAYTGVSLDDFFNVSPVYVYPVFDPGSKSGDVITLPLKNVALEGYTNKYEPIIAGSSYVFYLKGKPSSVIEKIIEDSSSADAPAEYYDLQGRRVDNPSTGVYIRRQGDKTTKVYVK